MLRIQATLAGLLLTTACTETQLAAPDPKDSFRKASSQAHQLSPEAEPIRLAELRPATCLQSELMHMAHAEIARWILPPAQGSGIVGSDLLRDHIPRVNGIALYRQPRPTFLPGICQIEGFDIWLRVPNESGLTYQQHLDPPLQPYQYQPFRRWKVAGSTLPSYRSGAPDCPAALPYREWFDAPSPAVLHRAVSRVEQAQRGLTRPRLHCRQNRYDEARQDFAHPACPNPRALLEKLMPNLIRRVRPADCELGPAPRGCLAIEYHDPAAPGTHSLYLVTVPDVDRPDYIQIVQALLPPS